MFIVLTNLINIIKQTDTFDIRQKYYDSSIHMYNYKGRVLPALLGEIKNLDGVEEVYTPIITRRNTAIEEHKLSEKYFKQIGKNGGLAKIPNSNFVIVKDVTIGAYDNNSLDKAKKHLLEGKVDEKLLDDNGVLLVQRKKTIKEGRETYVLIFLYRIKA